MEKIAILADSGCQIPVGSKEDQGIFIVPLTITMDEKSYFDDLEIHSEDVFKRMEKDGDDFSTINRFTARSSSKN